MTSKDALIEIKNRFSGTSSCSRNTLFSKQSFSIINAFLSNDFINFPIILPWELNNLFIISLFTDGRKSYEYTFDNLRRDIKLIRNSKSSIFYYDFKKWFTIYISQQQFAYQDNPFVLLYRYHYCFNFVNENINMNETFNNFFECDYREFENYLALIIMINYAQKDFDNIDPDIFKTIDNRFKKVVEKITISKQKLKIYFDSLMINELTYDNYFCPLTQFPYIKDSNKTYRAYHNLITACTSSLLYRLTNKNHRLNESFGKNVLENYLVQITKNNPKILDVSPEYYYKKGQLTPDLIATNGKSILLVESKSFSPNIRLRECDDALYKKSIDIIADAVKQLYRHCRYLFGEEYNIFNIPIDNKRKNIYGLVVLKNNPYFDNEDLYKVVSEKLDIMKDSYEYDWLVAHIGVVDISAYERFVMNKNLRLCDIANKKEKYDFWLNSINNIEYCDYILEFRNELLGEAEKEAKILFV